LPQSAFLFSIAGLSVTLVGFSGLISALARDGQRTPLLTYRLRQIPEMALASALITLISLPLADSIGAPAIAIRVASALAFAFTATHIAFLIVRTRAQAIRVGGGTWVFGGLVDTSLLVSAIVSVVTGQTAAYEWMLVFLVARPAVAFVLALNDVMARG
jgi:hypothetical protein